MFQWLLGFLSSPLDESDIAILAFLPGDHRSSRDYVGYSDVKPSRILLVTLPPGLPGMPAYPTVTRVIYLSSVYPV